MSLAHLVGNVGAEVRTPDTPFLATRLLEKKKVK
jgi:hypothetical protein